MWRRGYNLCSTLRRRRGNRNFIRLEQQLRKFSVGLHISNESYSKFAENGDYQGSIRSSLVKLRDYPLMTNGDAPNWPPLWMQSRIGGGVKAVNGEVGVLIYVHAGADSPKCYLVIEDENENYTGTLLFDNARLCVKLRTFYKTISVDQSKRLAIWT
jgi:hypothetical protein